MVRDLGRMSKSSLKQKPISKAPRNRIIQKESKNITNEMYECKLEYVEK